MKVQLSEGPLDGTSVDVDEDSLVEGFPIYLELPSAESRARPARDRRVSEASSSTCTRDLALRAMSRGCRSQPFRFLAVALPPLRPAAFF